MDPRGSSAYVGGAVVLGRGNRQGLRLDTTCQDVSYLISLNPSSNDIMKKPLFENGSWGVNSSNVDGLVRKYDIKLYDLFEPLGEYYDPK